MRKKKNREGRNISVLVVALIILVVAIYVWRDNSNRYDTAYGKVVKQIQAHDAKKKAALAKLDQELAKIK